MVRRSNGRRGSPFSWEVGGVQDPIQRLRQLAQDQGEVAQFEWQGVRCYLLSSPRLIQRAFTHPDLHKRQGKPPATCLLGQGLMTSQGALNQSQRKLLRPLFAAAFRAAWRDLVLQELDLFCGSWRVGQQFRSLEEFGRLSMAVACRVLLGRRLDEERRMAELLEGALHSGGASVRGPLEEIAARLLSQGRGPLVEQLLSVPLDEQLRRDEIITMLLGAHETTGTTLAFCMRMLALHGGQGTPHQIVGETLRLYPPGWMVSRNADSDLQLDEVCLRGPCTVLMSPMVTHYLPQLWEQPHLFRPERFPLQPPPGGTFFPFGGGRRVCIGESLAWLVAETVVEYLRPRWRLQPLDPGPVQLLPLASLRPACGLPVSLGSAGAASR